MKNYETFSTTADVGIRIRGKGCEELFQSAVRGLNVLYFGEAGNRVQPRLDSDVRPHAFEFHGDGCENVLVNLLSEIVFLLQNQDKITIGIKVREAGESYVKADLTTIPRHLEPGIEIKAVTYHNLKIKKENGILWTEIIFDV